MPQAERNLLKFIHPKLKEIPPIVGMTESLNFILIRLRRRKILKFVAVKEYGDSSYRRNDGNNVTSYLSASCGEISLKIHC